MYILLNPTSYTGLLLIEFAAKILYNNIQALITNLPNNDPSGAVKSAKHITFNQTSEKPKNLNIVGVRKWRDKSLRSSKVN